LEKAIGSYLLKAKYATLRFLDDESSQRNQTVLPLKEELQKLAADTDALHLPYYPPVHEGRLIAALDQIQGAKRELSTGDKLIVDLEDKRYEVDLTKTWEPSDSIAISNLRETHSDGELILTIRRPDFIKDTLWQFTHGKNNISAPIKDEKWLEDFHNRKINLLPGDALRCKVHYTHIYDEKGALLEQKIEILLVLEILKGQEGEQIGMFPQG
jgi:hypothetical protein